MIPRARAVHEQLRLVVDRAHHNIDLPVVVERAERCPAVKSRRKNGTAGCCADVREGEVPVVAQQPVRLQCWTMEHFQLVIQNCPAGNKQILPSVVIEIERARAPGRHAMAECRHAGDIGHIVKLRAAVLVKRESVAEHRSVKNLRQPIIVEIAEVRPHAGDDAAIGCVSDPLLQGRVLEGAIAVVVHQKIGRCVIGHKDVSKAVIIVVGERQSHAFAHIPSDMRRQRDIPECSLAVILVQNIWGTFEVPWRAIRARIADGAELGVGNVVVQVIDDDQI